MFVKNSVVQPEIEDFEDDNGVTNYASKDIKKYEPDSTTATNNDVESEKRHHHQRQHHSRQHHHGNHHSEDKDVEAAPNVSEVTEVTEVTSAKQPINIFFRAKSEADSLIIYLPANNDPIIECISEMLFKPYHPYLKAFAYSLWAMQFISLVALMYSLLPCPTKKISWIVICGIPLCCLYGKKAN